MSIGARERVERDEGRAQTAARPGRIWIPTPTAALLLLVAVVLRVVALERQSLWLDEFLAFSIGQHDVPTVLEHASVVPGQLPLYYLLVHVWSLAFGEGSAAVVRSLSVVLGSLSLLQLYAFARRFTDETRARVALGILAFSPLHVYFSQEARMYPLFIVLVLAIVHLSLSAVRDASARGPARWTAIALLTAGSVYTHYYAFLFLGALDLFLVLTWRRSRPVIFPIAIAQVIGFLSYVPWLSSFLHAAESGGNAFIRFVGLKGFYTAFTFALGYSAVILDADNKNALVQAFVDRIPLLVTAAAAFGFIALRGARSLWRADRELLLLIGLLLLFPVGVSTLVSYRFPIISERYFTPALPFFALLLACGIVSARGLARWLPAGVAASLVALSLGHYYFDPRFGNHDWRAAAGYVEARARGDEEMLFHPGFVEGCYRFYAHETPVGRGLDTVEAAEALPADRGYWLVISHPRPAMEGIVAALDARFERRDDLWLPRGEGIRVLRYAPRAR
ncbi:MAG TPA: glycosyltransferase family 39 protein [Myxococcota bacterium]|nr:glycosyltransferase family 39 protein [Myxococcota bacterium]